MQLQSHFTTISKIFGRQMATQIKSYVSEFDLLQKEQSGFREHHSCNVLLDYSNAFDLVSNSILIHNLKVYKFSEWVLYMTLVKPCTQMFALRSD